MVGDRTSLRGRLGIALQIAMSNPTFRGYKTAGCGAGGIAGKLLCGTLTAAVRHYREPYGKLVASCSIREI